jgi:MYXO-CTERM domain-containing protein
MLSYINGFFDTIMLVTAQQSGLIGLSNWGGQDQIMSPVMIPLPNSALLGLAGMAGLGVVAVVRRRHK